MWPSLSIPIPSILMAGTLSHSVYKLTSQHSALIKGISVFMWNSTIDVNKCPSWFDSHPVDLFKHEWHPFLFKLTGSHAPGAHVASSGAWSNLQLLRSVWCKKLPDHLSREWSQTKPQGPWVLSATVALYKCAALPADENRRLILDSLESAGALSCSCVFQKYFSSFWLCQLSHGCLSGMCIIPCLE